MSEPCESCCPCAYRLLEKVQELEAEAQELRSRLLALRQDRERPSIYDGARER